MAATRAVGGGGRRDDARAQNRELRSALTDAAFDQIRALVDIGRGRLLEEVRSFFADAEATDVLVLALSGEIVKNDEGALYFPSAPTGRRLEHGAVELDAVGEAIRHCPARSIVVLLNCDYSGWFDDGPDGRTRAVPHFDLRRVFPVDRCVVIATDAADSTAGSFNRGVVGALTGAAHDRDGDGWIDTADLEEHLRSAADSGAGPLPVLITEAPAAPLARARPRPPAQSSEEPPTQGVDPTGADGELAAEITVLTAGLLGECRTGPELHNRLRVELRSTGFSAELAAEVAARAENLLTGADADPNGPKEFPGQGPDPETEVMAFGVEVAALALRLKRDRAADAAHETVRAPASLEWTAPLDDARWRTLLAHHRDTLTRDAVRTHLVNPTETDSWTLLSSGRELLMSGIADTVAATSGEPRLARAAAQRGQTLRYGYPLILVRGASGGDVAALRAVPLFVLDVQVRERDGVPHLCALGPGELNPALLRAGVAGLTGNAEYEALRVWWQAQREGPEGGDFAAKIRLMLAHLGVDRVDDIVPDALGGALDPVRARPGAYNLAMVFRAGAEAVEPLLSDLDDTSGEGMDVARIGSTALAALTGLPGPRSEEPVLPITATDLSEAHHRALESAMNRRLTVVAAPPGAGARTLVTAAAHTAIAAGQSVLFVGPDAAAADEFAARASGEAGIEHLVVRTGGAEHLGAEAATLEKMAHVRGEDADPAALRAGLERDWATSRIARLAIDAISRTERELALLADARGRIIDGGWDPEALFRGRRPREWLRLSEQANRRFRFGAPRSSVRRGLGASSDPAGLTRVCQIARIELDWTRAVDVWSRTTALEELHGDLTAAAARRQASGIEYLAAVVERRRVEGLQAVARRLESLRWRSKSLVWSGLTASLTAVPARAVEAGRARALPPRAGLFDLVIVDAADRCGVAGVLPLLYRAKRALIVGDPARPAPSTVPEEALEERGDLGGRGGPAPRWIIERALGGPEASAYRALARSQTEAGGRVLWLEEHDRSHPLIAEAADRYCYGGRLSVCTDPRPLPGADRPVRWYDVVGDCEPESVGSFTNREEAYRTAALLRELDARLPDGVTVGVASPFRHQRALLHRLMGRWRLTREVRIEALSAFGPRPCDAIIVSPVLSGTGPSDRVARELADAERWSPVLTAAVARLIVVGDRDFWRSTGGVPAGLADLAEAPPRRAADPALDALADVLRGMSDSVTSAPVVRGHRVDLRVDTPQGSVLVLLDRTRDGPGLRRLLRRLDRLREVTGLPVLRAPAWRCLHAPETLAKEIMLAGSGNGLEVPS